MMSVLPMRRPDADQPLDPAAPDCAGPDPAPDTIARLRRAMAAMSSTPDLAPATPGDRHADVLSLPDTLSDLLPQRGIPRGCVTGCAGARSLLSAVVAAVTQAGGQVAIIGLPWFGMLSAVEMGALPERVALVPDPGVDPVEVASVLLDGMDLVVLGLRGVDVSPSRSRVVTGRVRQQGAALLIVDGHWPGTQIRLDARVLTYRHLPDVGGVDLATARRGHGRVGGVRLRVTAEGRDRRRRVADIELLAGPPGGAAPVTMTRYTDAMAAVPDATAGVGADAMTAAAHADTDVAVAN